MQRVTREQNWRLTRCNISSVMEFTKDAIEVLISSRLLGLASLIFCFINPQKKKSRGFRSGDRGGQRKSEFFEITRVGNLFFKNSMAMRDVCAGAPSCWKTVPLSTDSESSGKIWANMSVYRSLVTVTAFPVSESS